MKLPELMDRRQWTPYRIAKESGGRISTSTAYRLDRMRGQLATFDAEMLEALCDVFHCEPGDLFEREKRPVRPRPAKPKGRPRQRPAKQVKAA